MIYYLHVTFTGDSCSLHNRGAILPILQALTYDTTGSSTVKVGMCFVMTSFASQALDTHFGSSISVQYR